ncbi:MAG TPA: hypothetical protein VF721_11205 [Pyrinomonadaceae bacterium]|jgi:drug/metabolite transporter superfamily protein YnfA
MKRNIWESILFLIVGLLAGIHGAYDLENINRQDESVWWTIWSLFRLIAGFTGVILGVQGVLQSRKS